jgi:DNA-binding NarL/FixJ family response regulator
MDNIKRRLAAHVPGETALQKHSPARPQVLHMNYNLPQMSDKQYVQQLKELLSETQVIVLTICENGEEHALKAGSKGYLLKRTTPDKSPEAVCKVHF